MKKQTLLLLIAMVTLYVCGCSVKHAEYGVKDDKLQAMIMDLNNKDELYKTKQYQQIAKILESSITSSEISMAVKQSQLHELADLYSYYLFDLERAVELDNQIQKIGLVSKAKEDMIYSNAANNVILSNQEYAQKYANLEPERLLLESKQRLLNNIKLLQGEEVSLIKKRYSEDFLINNLNQVKEDFKNSVVGSKEYYMLYSRMLKNEYMLFKISNDSRFLSSYSAMQHGAITIDKIYYDEIDFLTLTNYLLASAKKANSLQLAEMALSVIYQPYLMLKDDANMWTYNKIINSVINKIIELAISQKNNIDALYYISLNKSRMIVEESYSADKLSSRDRRYMLRLPSKAEFYKKIKVVNNYLDFYIVGNYIEPKDIRKKSLKFFSDVKNIFSSSGMYVSYIHNGNVDISFIDSKDLSKIEKNVEEVYHKVSSFSSLVRSAKKRGLRVSSITHSSNLDVEDALSKLVPASLDKNSHIVVSADKWLNKMPFDVLTNKPTTRTLNLFLLDTNRENETINPNIIGYFNPTKDLPDAEDEIPLISRYHSNFRYYKRDDASKDKLRVSAGQNILHLSMHGYNNSNDPEYSKLLFSNSRKDESKNDPNALYAKEIHNFVQLKNNKLIFTAACETGLTRSSQNNSEELIGILRPLLLGNNENIILTLWEIDSESARDFVEYFYSNLADSRNIFLAFTHAKQQLKKKYKDPYFWAPYYLITQKGVNK